MWYVVQINQCRPEEVDSLSEQLEELGAVSITLTDEQDNPVLEPLPGTTPLWPHVAISALFTEADDALIGAHSIQKDHPHCIVTTAVLEDQDWTRSWMSQYQPLQFGRFWVCPSWLTPPDPKAINLILDPGLAFGTGTHPTTALCLDWLGHAEIEQKDVIDYGCGSGILALAACKLGAKKVYAVDIDEQALTATQNNAKTNQINNSQLAVSLAEHIQATADILIANILLEPLLALKACFSSLLKPQGILVVSGILDEQAATLIHAYEHSFTLIQHQSKDGWSLLTLSKKD